MEEKLGQSTAVLFKYEKLILAEEETTSYESEIYLPRLWDTLGL